MASDDFQLVDAPASPPLGEAEAAEPRQEQECEGQIAPPPPPEVGGDTVVAAAYAADERPLAAAEKALAATNVDGASQLPPPPPGEPEDSPPSESPPSITEPPPVPQQNGAPPSGRAGSTEVRNASAGGGDTGSAASPETLPRTQSPRSLSAAACAPVLVPALSLAPDCSLCVAGEEDGAPVVLPAHMQILALHVGALRDLFPRVCGPAGAVGVHAAVKGAMALTIRGSCVDG